MEPYHELLRLDSRVPTFFESVTPLPRVTGLPHWHEACEILLIRRGTLRHQINADIRLVYPGQVILICPGDVHGSETLPPDGCDVGVLQFVTSDLAAFGHSWAELSSAIITPEDDGFLRLFDALSTQSRDVQPGQSLIMDGLLRIVIALLFRSTAREDFPSRTPFIRSVCTYMEHADDLRLETIATHFGYCPEHLSRRFHEETGLPYRLYCDRLRMRRAAFLLHDTEDDIASISEQLGYSDSSSFIRAFRRVYGITPSAHRRLCQPIGIPHSEKK